MIQEKVEEVNYIIEYKDYIIGFLTLLCSFFYYRMKKKDESIKSKELELEKIKDKVSEKKYKLYNDMYDVIFNLINTENTSILDIRSNLLKIKKELFIYAPEEILLNFLYWEKKAKEEKDLDIKDFILRYLKILALIRKDMGNENSTIDAEDIYESLTINEP